MSRKILPFGRPLGPISEGQNSPVALDCSGRAPQNKKKGEYDHARGAVLLRCAMRLPLLSLSDQALVEASCYERGVRIFLRARSRRPGTPLARIDDWPVLSYVASRALFSSTFGQAFHMLDIRLVEICAALNFPAGHEDLVIDSLRRLTATAVTLENWTDRSRRAREYPTDFPLIRVTCPEPGVFRVILSDFLTDELYDRQILRSYQPVSDPFAHRLQAWAYSWVGRDINTGRQVISQRDALSRLGPLPDGLTDDPWTYLVEAVEKNEIPGFRFELTERWRQPAIEVHKLVDPIVAPASSMPDQYDESIDGPLINTAPWD